MTLDEKYHELAERSLENRHIDAEAYIVKILSEMELRRKGAVTTNDRVPESKIDEHIDSMQDYFVKYMNDKTTANLEEFLTSSKRILSEVFHDCDTKEKRDLFRKIFDEMKNIV